MAASKCCPTCGAKMVEYKHGLSKGLARTLYRIANGMNADRVYGVREIGLTNSQYDNHQKLRYWGLIERLEDESRKGGRWRLTDVGFDFVRGVSGLRKYVWTYRGDVVRFDGDAVWIAELTDGWRFRPDYARDAQPTNTGAST